MEKERFTVDSHKYYNDFLEYVLIRNFLGIYGKDEDGYFTVNNYVSPDEMVITEHSRGRFDFIFGLRCPLSEYESLNVKTYNDYFTERHFVLIQDTISGRVYEHSINFTGPQEESAFQAGFVFDPFDWDIHYAVRYCLDPELEEWDTNHYTRGIAELGLEDMDSKLRVLGETIIDELMCLEREKIEEKSFYDPENTFVTVKINDDEDYEDYDDYEDDEDEYMTVHWSYAFYELDPEKYEIYVQSKGTIPPFGEE